MQYALSALAEGSTMRGNYDNECRVCDVCYLENLKPGDQIRKEKILETISTLCGYLLYKRTVKMEEL
jgi:hypothetical protein